MQVLETALGYCDQLARDYPELPEAAEARAGLAACLGTATGIAATAPVFFAASSHVAQLADFQPSLSAPRDRMAACINKLGPQHPVALGLQTVLATFDQCSAKVEAWCKNTSMLASTDEKQDNDVEAGLHCLLFKSILGVQEMLKSLGDLVQPNNSDEGSADNGRPTVILMNQLAARLPKLKAAAVATAAGRLATRFQLAPSAGLCAGLADSLLILRTYQASLTALLGMCLSFSREFAKLLSVVLKVFHQIAIQVLKDVFVGVFGYLLF
jgi:hypothetical protein